MDRQDLSGIIAFTVYLLQKDHLHRRLAIMKTVPCLHYQFQVDQDLTLQPSLFTAPSCVWL